MIHATHFDPRQNLVSFYKAADLFYCCRPVMAMKRTILPIFFAEGSFTRRAANQEIAISMRSSRMRRRIPSPSHCVTLTRNNTFLRLSAGCPYRQGASGATLYGLRLSKALPCPSRLSQRLLRRAALVPLTVGAGTRLVLLDLVAWIVGVSEERDGSSIRSTALEAVARAFRCRLTEQPALSHKKA